MANRMMIVGRLTKDPELRQTSGGNPAVYFTVAVPRRFKTDVTDFFESVAWGKTAEFICKYFTKGKLIDLDGRPETWVGTDKNGNERKSFKLNVEVASFVGDKPKGEAQDGEHLPPASLPQGIDPFAGAEAPAYTGSPGDFVPLGDEDEEGDLPF